MLSQRSRSGTTPSLPCALHDIAILIRIPVRLNHIVPRTRRLLRVLLVPPLAWLPCIACVVSIAVSIVASRTIAGVVHTTRSSCIQHRFLHVADGRVAITCGADGDVAVCGGSGVVTLAAGRGELAGSSRVEVVIARRSLGTVVVRSGTTGEEIDFGVFHVDAERG